MKMVKIASGVKRIEDSDVNAVLFRLRDVLSEHRGILISRLMSDLPAYVDYKFRIKMTSRQAEAVKEHLYVLKNSTLDIDRYQDIIDHFMANEMTHVGSEPFLKEIDDNISSLLNATQLKLVG